MHVDVTAFLFFFLFLHRELRKCLRAMTELNVKISICVLAADSLVHVSTDSVLMLPASGRLGPAIHHVAG